MLPNALIKGLDERRFRNLLVLFFLALAVPTAVLIWQAYSQLKWEAFHQYRGAAEELTRRIDTGLNDMIRTADARSFADYTFLVVSGDPNANFVQRSPLSDLPVIADVPGVMGYFQVDTEGTFSTPLLPPPGTEPASLGIGGNEYNDRLRLAEEIQTILADNRLVQPRSELGVGGAIGLSVATPAIVVDGEERAAVGGRSDARSLDNDVDAGPEGRPSGQIAAANESYSQQIFDRLNRPGSAAEPSAIGAGTLDPDDAARATAATEQSARRSSKVSELKLDAALQQKSEAIERESAKEQLSDGGFADTRIRAKRREKIALPETLAAAEGDSIANLTGPKDLRISTFESEIDPFEFSLLDSGHLVLFRKVWRGGERYIQGLLVDQAAFTQHVIGAHFVDTALSAMSSLIVAYQDSVIQTFGGGDQSGYPDFAQELDGALLYRSRLTAPLDSLELIFSITRLPPGAGATVLGWVTVVLAAVIVGGFALLYRLGLSQINLARQQQDFVSAVSHELKTPLTSIRMYGEMLKEGWAAEDKRQSYYEFIHDEAERLSRLIANVLQLARITRNEPQINLQPVNVGALMRDTESKISSQAERAGFRLRFNSSDAAEKATISIDADCFAQIIINLVDNAIKFSGNAAEKTIDVTSKRTSDSCIQISVRDFGPGIPKDQRQKIFELFYRSESELTRETVGTGIGLAIVHQLTLAMNGSVDMVNVDPGAEFRITFSAID